MLLRVPDLLNSLGVGQRGDVTNLLTDGLGADDATHDLARARFRNVIDESDVVGTGNLADLDADVLAKLCSELLTRLDAPTKDDERCQ